MRPVAGAAGRRPTCPKRTPPWFVDLLHGPAFKQPEPGLLAEAWWVCPGCQTPEDVAAGRRATIAAYVGVAHDANFLRSEGLNDETIAAIHAEARRQGYDV